LGPIFQTTTKENPHPIVPIKTQKKLSKKVHIPLLQLAESHFQPLNNYGKGDFHQFQPFQFFKENGAKTYKELLRIYQSLQF